MDSIPTDNRKRLVIDISTVRQLAGICVLIGIVYVLFSYGGIRSPDSEVVFRSAESLAMTGSFGLTSQPAELQNFGKTPFGGSMNNFGMPAGKDGRFYSIFGPGQALASVPLVDLAIWINKSGWYESFPDFIPISHFVGLGVVDFVKGTIPADLKPHALRFLVCFFNIFVGVLCVCFFFLTVRLLTGSDFAARWTSILFAFGSLILPYSGTFFSEPLATLFIILSMYCLIWNDTTEGIPSKQTYFSLLSSGLFLGMATTVHISSILYAPFFFAYGIYPFLRKRRSAKEFIVPGTIFTAGFALFLVLLGYHNYVRFGNILETGRTAVPGLDYATFVAPWRGLYGLVLGSGKGIVWYCPSVLIGIFLWRPFHKRFPVLSYTILGSVFFRVIFVASRSDWHGGFSLGPRYLVMAVPLLMLPIGQSIVEWRQQQSLRTFWLFFLLTLVCVGEQIYFSVGEIFSFLHIVKWQYLSHGINVLTNDALYLDWNKSPLLYLLDAERGPFLMRTIPVSNGALFALCLALAGIMLSLEYARSLKKHFGRWR
jgi:hypothetical protein